MTNDVAFPEDSRAAILRIAILVAYSDGTWHDLERAHLADVYQNICVMLDEDLDEETLSRELDEISMDVPDEIESLTDDDDTEAYWQNCLESIVSEDIQHLAVAAAVALAIGDGEIDSSELTAISRLCEAWDIELSDAEAIWTD